MSASQVTKSVVQLVEGTPDVNNEGPFETMWTLCSELRAKIDARFQLQLDPSTEKFASYCNEKGQGQGTLKGLSGPEMDWMVHSWMGTPKSSFTNMHLTAWLGPQIKVPHLWMALGTIPDVFMYFDYGPRTDMYTDIEYLDHYYEQANPSFLETLNAPDMPAFISQDLCTRQFISPTGICLAGMKPTPELFERIAVLAHEYVDRWLRWVDEAAPVPVEERPALAARDLATRQTITIRDPANQLATNLYGEAFKDELVGALWGQGRVLPRPQ